MPINGYFDKKFGESGDLTPVPDAVQADGTVSYTQGWGIKYSTKIEEGGLNIERPKTNQVLYDITAAIQTYQQFYAPPFITSLMNNGTPFSYAAYARVLYAGVVYQSLVSGNTDTPPSAKWAAVPLSPRIQLTANTTFYVSTTGNDSTGTGAVGSPWATIQKAVNVLTASYDLAGFTATIQVADGTYTGAVNLSTPCVGGTLVIQGNTVTPSNCIISTTSANCFTSTNGVSATIRGFKLQTTTSGSGIAAVQDAVLTVGNINFGTIADYGVYTLRGGGVFITNAITISGNMKNAVLSDQQSWFNANSQAYTLSGTPAFSSAFTAAQQNSTQIWSGVTFTGTATGSRYAGTLNGVINTSGGGASFLPGNAAGTTATGAQYA